MCPKLKNIYKVYKLYNAKKKKTQEKFQKPKFKAFEL